VKPEKWIRVTPAENIPVRQGRAVSVEGTEIAIFNLGDRFVAIGNECPHQGGPLCDGIVAGTSVVCPLHGWKIDLDGGGVLSPSVPACVPTFQTRVENGIVLLDLIANATGAAQVAA
jgi:nitrite reductase [NAD(P)H] small subunit